MKMIAAVFRRAGSCSDDSIGPHVSLRQNEISRQMPDDLFLLAISTNFRDGWTPGQVK